jgi:pimeloyl-ACP methyl ester carboxylesterase
MEHAKVNGIQLEHEAVGSGEPMLLIHGAHIADALRPLVAEPALERYQRIRYHRRGLGESTRPVETGPTSVAVQAAAVACPVLSVLGSNSSPLSVEGHRLLHAWLPACQDADIVGATHLLQMQAPGPVAAAIAAPPTGRPAAVMGWPRTAARCRRRP